MLLERNLHIYVENFKGGKDTKSNCYEVTDYKLMIQCAKLISLCPIERVQDGSGGTCNHDTYNSV